MLEDKKSIGSTVFQAIFNFGCAEAERVFDLELFMIKVSLKEMIFDVLCNLT